MPMTRASVGTLGLQPSWMLPPWRAAHAPRLSRAPTAIPAAPGPPPGTAAAATSPSPAGTVGIRAWREPLSRTRHASDVISRIAAGGDVAVTAAELVMRTRIMHAPPAEVGAWLVERLPRLGMTFVKLGQLVSTRPDVFGDEVCDALAGLRDRVRPLSPEAVAALLEAHPAGPDVFTHVDAAAPIASATIGQVHRARLRRSGREVALKIRRPGIADALRADIRLLDAVVSVAAATGAAENMEHTRRCLRDLMATLEQEVDFMAEAETMRRFRRRLMAEGLTRGVRVPRVHAELCTPDILVMEYLPSRPLLAAAPVADEPAAAATAPAQSTHAVSYALMDALFAQVFRVGIVHGDPHPGNIGLDAKGRVVFYDFGNVIRLSGQERYALKRLLWQLAVSDDAGATQSLRDLGATVDDATALRGLLKLYRTYAKTVDVAVIRDGHDPAARLPVRLSDKLIRLMRACSMLEGTCKAILPTFSYVDFLMHRVDDVLLDEGFLWRRASEDVRTLLDRMTAPST